MLAAQLHPPYSQEVKGIDARCVSNLIWALVKLDLAVETGCIGNDVILSISPLVLRLLSQSSPQVRPPQPPLSPLLCRIMVQSQASALQQPFVNLAALLSILAGPGQPAVGLRQAGRAPRGGHLGHHGADDGDAEPRPVRQPV